MKASARHQPPIEQPILDAALSRAVSFEGPGVARLSLMVTTVLDVLTEVDGTSSDSDPRPKPV